MLLGAMEVVVNETLGVGATTIGVVVEDLLVVGSLTGAGVVVVG